MASTRIISKSLTNKSPTTVRHNKQSKLVTHGPKNDPGMTSSTGYQLDLSGTAEDRVASLDRLNQLIRSDSRIPLQDPDTLFKSLSCSLADVDWSVRHRSLEVVSELVSLTELWPSLENQMALLAPQLVPRLADTRTTVRRAAVNCLRLVMRHSEDLPTLFRALALYGIEADSSSVHQEVCLTIPLILTPESTGEDYSCLIRALVARLGPASGKCLAELRHHIGDVPFEDQLENLGRTTANRYHRFTASPKLSQSNSLDMLDQLPNSSYRSSLARHALPNNSTSAPADPTTRGRPGFICGFIPPDLYQLLESSDAKQRFNAAEQLRQRYDDMGRKRTVESLLPELGDFLALLERLLTDNNFHVVKNALEILGGVVSRLPEHVVPFSSLLLTFLIQMLGDFKKVVQVGVMRYAMCLVRYLGARPVLGHLAATSLINKNSRIRQETINIIIGALLQFPSGDFDLDGLCPTVAPLLIDKKPAVRQAALECMAVLAHLLGSGRLGPLSRAVNAVELSSAGVPGIMETLQSRLARHQLPKITTQGLVEYAATSVSIANSLTNQRKQSLGSTTGSVHNEHRDVDSSEGERRRPSASKARGLSKLPWERELTSAVTSGNESGCTTPGVRSMAGSPTFDQEKSFIKTGMSLRPTTDLTQLMRKEDIRKFKDIGHLSANQMMAASGSKSVPASGHTSPTDRLGQTSEPMTHRPQLDAGQRRRDSKNSGDTLRPQGGRGKRKLAPLDLNMTRDSTVLDNQGNSPPIPTKPTLARSASQRRHSRQQQRGEEGGLGSTLSSASTTERQDSGISTATNSVYGSSRGCRPSAEDERRRGAIRRESWDTPDTFADSEDEEMHRSLASIRNSATKKKALKDSENTEDEVFFDSSLIDDKRSGPSGVNTTKYSPYSGATFKENPTYDGLVIGRRYGDDFLPTAGVRQSSSLLANWWEAGSQWEMNTWAAATGTDLTMSTVGSETVCVASKQMDRKKPMKGTANLSPLGMASTSHHGPIQPPVSTNESAGGVVPPSASLVGQGYDAGAVPGVGVSNLGSDTNRSCQQGEDFNIVGKSVFEVGSPSSSSGMDPSLARLKGDAASMRAGGNPLPQTGIVGRGIVDKPEDEDIPSLGISRTLRESMAMKKKLRQQEARKQEREVDDQIAAINIEDRLEDESTVNHPPDRYRRSSFEGENHGNEYSSLNINGSGGPVGNGQTRGQRPPQMPRLSQKPVSKGRSQSNPRIPRSRSNQSLLELPDSHPPSSSSSLLTQSTNSPVLQPLSHPERSIGESLAAISIADWQSKVDGLTIVQRLCSFHADLLVSRTTDFHQVTLAICNECKNLRSQVSRQAIQVMGQLYLIGKKACEPDLDVTVRVLLQKAGESSSFIRDDVETALASMVASVPPVRAIGALIQGGAAHKNTAVRRTTAVHLAEVCRLVGPGRLLAGVKDMTDRVLTVAAQFTQDGNPETRYFGRKIFNGLMHHQDFEKLCVKHITSNTWRSLKDILENLRTKGLGELPSATPSATTIRRSVSMTRIPSPVSSSDADQQPPAGGGTIGGGDVVSRISGRLAAPDFRERQQGLVELDRLSMENPQLVLDNVIKLFDKFSPRLTDSNSKVSQQALTILECLGPRLGLGLGPVSTQLVQHTAQNLANKNQEIVHLASKILDDFIRIQDPGQLVPVYVQLVSNTNPRLRPTLVLKLAQLCTLLGPRKPRLFSLHVLPELWRLLTAVSGSGGAGLAAESHLRASVSQLVDALHCQLGEDSLLEAASKVTNPATPAHILVTTMLEMMEGS